MSTELPSGVSLPENAPEPGKCVRIERPEPGLAVLILDPPHRSLAVLDVPLLRDLGLALDELEKISELRGVVITGRTPKEFAAGADLDALGELNTPETVRSTVEWVHAQYARVEKLKARTVAAVGGAVPGGAYELSLCCDAIVTTDAKETKIGLPETQLGIFPAWGGVHRLPNRIGVAGALEVILGGRLYAAKQALRRGMVDRLTQREYLVAIASDIAMGRKANPRRSRGWKRWLVDKNPLASALFQRAAKNAVMKKTKGHYPAPLVALELIAKAPNASSSGRARRESDAVAPLVTGSICKNLIAIFRSSEDAKKLGRRAEGAKIERAAVVGGGVMGAGIARLLAQRGVAARLSDLSSEALDRAVLTHRTEVAQRVKQRRLSFAEGDAAIDRLDAVRGLVGLSRCQLAIEAVAEKLEIKQQVFSELAAQMPDDAILATNTSSLSVDAIAKGVPHPERFVGLHFFNPVKAMPLVEVVRGKHTTEDVALRAAACMLALGKTPVLVKDVPGFLVNRVLGPYLDEAVRLLEQGADIERVDKALVRFGMPMGPYALLDEVGLDIAAHAGASLAAAYGPRAANSDALDALRSEKRLGKKTGHGLYRHTQGKRPEASMDLARLKKGSAASSLSDEQLVDRLVLALINEAARCLAEEVVTGPGELDLAMIFGTGFAPFRGGPLRYADSLGLGEVVSRLEKIAESPDVVARGEGSERFRPAPFLRELATAKKAFHAQA